MNEIVTTIVGNLAADPEMRFTQDGVPVCRMRVANTPRKMNSSTNKMEDQPPTWVNVTCWRALAENVAASIDGGLKKGARVIVYGSLENREYEDKEGVKRTSLDMTAYAIGPDLTWVTTTIGKGAHEGAKDRKKPEPKKDPFEGASADRPASQAAPAAQPAAATAGAPSLDWD